MIVDVATVGAGGVGVGVGVGVVVCQLHPFVKSWSFSSAST